MFYKDLQLNLLFHNHNSIRSLKIIQNHEVNTGNPTVAVVIKAPAKIKKGR